MKKVIAAFFSICSSLWALPVFKSGNADVDFLTELALKEVQLNITKDGVFAAGEK